MKLRTILITFAIILYLSIPVLAGEIIATFETTLKINDDKVTVHISSFQFSPESLSINFSEYWKINGRHPLGGFPAKPTSRIGLFYVIWSDKRYNVPLTYYDDCFDPYLRIKKGWWDNQGGVSIRPADDGKSVLIEMEASQIACCGYSVIWNISNKGQVTRYVDSSIP